MGYDYDLVVIGGGAAGLVASKLGAGLGKKVAIVEKSRLGGECTLYGCVPSKALIKTARVYRQMGDPEAVGLGFASGAPPASLYTTDGAFPRVRSIIERVYRGHSPEVLERLGIELIIGLPRFLDRHHIGLEKRVVSARSFIICTGSSPLVPAIPGIDAVPYLTNETLFGLNGLPASMAVLGAGPIGMEMAQAFAYLGTAVTVIEAGNRILAREDVELADLLAGRMAGHGIELLTGTKAVGAKRDGEKIDVTVEDASGARKSLVVEKLLVAVGRRPNIEGLDLETAGIEYSRVGIKADDHMRTTAHNIYTCGDVTGPYQFSHMAEYQARIAARDALVPFKATASYNNYIWCTFTDPEFAHAGLTEEEARATHTGVRVYRWKFADTDRGKTEGDEFGMAKFICDRKGMLLGAHILGDRAGELIHEAQILKTFGIPFHKLDSVIHVYPTLTDVVRQPAKMAHIDRLRNNPLIRIAQRLFGRK